MVQTSTDQKVIDRERYGLLRHPSYTGLLAAFLGCGRMWGNWVGAIASVLLLLLLLLAAVCKRLVREEAAMVAAFGNAYLDYARHRARLVPYVR